MPTTSVLQGTVPLLRYSPVLIPMTTALRLSAVLKILPVLLHQYLRGLMVYQVMPVLKRRTVEARLTHV